MSRAYIYMEHPQSGELVTLGRLTLQGDVGEFMYAPDLVDQNGWVPDPFNYPLRREPYIGIRKNRGIPGFIGDAMPDGWGERLLHRVYGEELAPIDFLLKSPNNDRIGNLLFGKATTPAPSLGSEPVPTLRGLAKFVQACDAVYDRDMPADSAALLNMREQRSALGGARPKRTLLDEGVLILAKPRDRFDHHDLAAVEYACMTFAGLMGLNVAKTALHAEYPSTLLIKRFDRTPIAAGARRVPMLSALTLLDSEWNSQHHADWQYAAVADEMRRRAVPDSDLHEFYKRMCYNALVGNSDDHPRNHAIIWLHGGWRLSPMYDVLPILDEGPAQTLAMAVGSEGTRINRANLLSHHRHFALSLQDAERSLNEVLAWRDPLRAHYQQCLRGDELRLACEAINTQL